MRLDSEAPLHSATVEAIRDLLGGDAPPPPDDAAFLALVLGIADAPTRAACAHALLASPAARARLLRTRAALHEGLGTAPPQGEALDDLRRLAAFAGAFDEAAAAAAFPGRFADGERLRRLADQGWLDVEDAWDGARFRLPPAFRTLRTPLSDATWALPFARHHAEIARRVDRLRAEGRGAEAAVLLRRTLPDLRRAWRLADAADDVETVAAFVEILVAELAESGAWEALADLAEVGYRAADALDRPRLRSRLLGYQGVAASRGGDPARAAELWKARVALNRRIGNPVGEADALLDLASDAAEAGDEAAWRNWIDQAADALHRTDRPDMEASLTIQRAQARLRASDLEGAAKEAERALAGLSGPLGLDGVFHVRVNVARILARCGWRVESLGSGADLLELALENNRPVSAASALVLLADLVEEDGRATLAGRCVGIALAIRLGQGTYHAAALATRVEAMRAANPESWIADVVPEAWAVAATGVLAEIRDALSAPIEA